MMYRNKSAQAHHFSMVPQQEVPRSAFDIQKNIKTTFDTGYLVPIYVDEVLPGDSFNVSLTAFCRLATPIFPVMDNLHLETFFFFVPYRLVWDNFKRMMGERDRPDSSISYTVPQLVSPAGGFAVLSLWDYFGLPTSGQVAPAGTVSVSALPGRAYNLIWNEWFRDQNLQNPLPVTKSDGPDNISDYGVARRGKRFDYFTSCLPWPQKGESVGIPLAGSAPLVVAGGSQPWMVRQASDAAPYVNKAIGSGATGQLLDTTTPFTELILDPMGRLEADLSQSTAATINQLRQASAIQKLLERDARGGTRYTEQMFRHFGVRSPDARLQRPEYLGGGSTPIVATPVAQTSGSPGTGGYTNTPLATLSAVMTGLASHHGFSQAFTEHGVIIGLAHVRADLTYQQGLRKMWTRKTKYDHYWPEFSNLGEQAVLNQEIYCQGTGPGNGDDSVFGYQERWSELRYQPNEICGLFRSTTTGTIDAWHLAQRFNGLPVLGPTFIEDNPPVDRVLAVGAAANGQQLLMDAFYKIRAVRPLPMYSVPGLGPRL